MTKTTDDGMKPDPLALSIWERFSELADRPEIASSMDQALRSLEDFRAQKQATRRKAARVAATTTGALAIVCMALAPTLWRDGAPGGVCLASASASATPSAWFAGDPGDRRVFIGAPVATVVAEMNRSARRPIMLTGSWQGDYRLTANMCPGDTDGLAALLTDTGMAQEVETTDGSIVLAATCRAGCDTL